jgi:hypothetical protein
MAKVKDKTNGRTHHYNAEAAAISGNLSLPVSQPIVPLTHAKLPAEGGYFSQRTDEYRLESIITMKSSYTHVTGNLDSKPGKGWTTLVTTVVEGLNVMEVVTADRIVAQIITEHPLVGYVPTVSFLGTRFENLRIAGYPVEVLLDWDVLGPKPANDGAYVLSSSAAGRFSGTFDYLKGHRKLPGAVRKRYNQLSSTLGLGTPQDEIECSLVKGLTGNYPGETSGHAITIPKFGTIVLAKLIVKHEDYQAGTKAPKTKTPKKTTISLTMIDFHFGCPIGGSGSTGTGSSNGSTVP